MTHPFPPRRASALALDAKEQAEVAAAKLQILSQWSAASDIEVKGRNIYGKADAEFTLVEFSDLECPFCKRFHDTPKSLVEQAGGDRKSTRLNSSHKCASRMPSTA